MYIKRPHTPKRIEVHAHNHEQQSLADKIQPWIPAVVFSILFAAITALNIMHYVTYSVDDENKQDTEYPVYDYAPS